MKEKLKCLKRWFGMTLLGLGVSLAVIGAGTNEVRADGDGGGPGIIHAADCPCGAPCRYFISGTTHKFEAVNADGSYEWVEDNSAQFGATLVKTEGDAAWFSLEGAPGESMIIFAFGNGSTSTYEGEYTDEFWYVFEQYSDCKVMAKGETTQLKLYARHFSQSVPNGETVDISSWASWSVPYDDKVNVSADGQVKAVKSGDSLINVTITVPGNEKIYGYAGQIRIKVLIDRTERTDGDQVTITSDEPCIYFYFTPKESGVRYMGYNKEAYEEDVYVYCNLFQLVDGQIKGVKGENIVAGTTYIAEMDASYYPGVTYTYKLIPKNKLNAEYIADKLGPEEDDKTDNGVKKGDSVKVGVVTYKVTASDGKTKTVEYSKNGRITTSVTIPASVKINGVSYKVTSIARDAFKGNTKITSVKIGNYVESIGSNAFYGCKKLKTVTLGSNVTKVGSQAFANCPVLTTVTGASKVTEIGNKAFYKCVKLVQVGSTSKAVTLSKVKTIGDSVFNGCKAIKKVNLTSTVLTKIGSSAFQGCTSMTSFTEKSAKLSSIGSKAFYGDKKLATITLKSTKLTKSNVKSNAFKGIKSTCKFKVPSSKVKSYKEIFQAKGAGKKIKVTK